MMNGVVSVIIHPVPGHEADTIAKAVAALPPCRTDLKARRVPSDKLPTASYNFRPAAHATDTIGKPAAQWLIFWNFCNGAPFSR
ncbi:MAG: hypothetical protein Q4E06_10175 [Lautropia sp.]|nr:hypothetical protein [Lautropia sp.]